MPTVFVGNWQEFSDAGVEKRLNPFSTSPTAESRAGRLPRLGAGAIFNHVTDITIRSMEEPRVCATTLLTTAFNDGARLCARCTASDLLRWSGLDSASSATTDGITFPMRRVAAGRSLVQEGQPFETLYLVSGGSFKCVQTDEDGYEQVLAFAIHGDFIGLDGLGQNHTRSGAVALEDSTAVSISVAALLDLGHDLPALETLLHRAAGTEVARRGENQYLMAAPSSEVRVARFLLQFAQRQECLGHSGRRLRMCMTRRDIASYLGVAHETVSRVLMSMAREGFITVCNRDIELLDKAALIELQRLTRGRQARDRRADIARQIALDAACPASCACHQTLQ